MKFLREFESYRKIFKYCKFGSFDMIPGDLNWSPDESFFIIGDYYG